MTQFFCVIFLLAAFAVSALIDEIPTNASGPNSSNSTASFPDPPTASDPANRTASKPANSTASFPDHPTASDPANRTVSKPANSTASNPDPPTDSDLPNDTGLVTSGPVPKSSLLEPETDALTVTRQKRAFWDKIYSVLVDGTVKFAKNIGCEMNRKLCSCGKGACIEHKGYTATGLCCAEGYELQCCINIPTTTKPTKPTPAPPLLVQLSNACDKQKANCKCGFANCIRKEGTRESTCCANDYEFQCCATVPTTTPTPPTPPTTPTTTLLPEQQLEKACTDAARRCSCGWAKCTPEPGSKGSYCCMDGHAFKCCVDPERPYKLVAKKPADLLHELLSTLQCKDKNALCLCGAGNLELTGTFDSYCCDNAETDCECCKNERFLDETKPHLTLNGAEGCGVLVMCYWSEGTPATDCCPDGYKKGSSVPLTTYTNPLIEDSECPNGVRELSDKKECFEWEQIKFLEAVPKPTVKPEHMQVDEKCRPALQNCACGWGKCVAYPGWSASGCCAEGFSFQCCTTALPPPAQIAYTGPVMPTATAPMIATDEPTEEPTDEPDSAHSTVVPSAVLVMVALFALFAHI